MDGSPISLICMSHFPNSDISGKIKCSCFKHCSFKKCKIHFKIVYECDALKWTYLYIVIVHVQMYDII